MYFPGEKKTTKIQPREQSRKLTLLNEQFDNIVEEYREHLLGENLEDTKIKGRNNNLSTLSFQGWGPNEQYFKFFKQQLIMKDDTDLEANIQKSTKDKNKASQHHTDSILCCAIYSPILQSDEEGNKMLPELGPMLITGSWDKSIILWDLTCYDQELRNMRSKKTGALPTAMESIVKLEEHTKAVTSLFVFDPKSSKDRSGSSPVLISAGLDCKIIVWDLKVGHLVR